MQKIEALEQLIRKLGKTHPCRKLTVETPLHRVLTHHIINGYVLAYISGKIEKSYVFHPVVVIDKFGSIRGIISEIQKLLQL